MAEILCIVLTNFIHCHCLVSKLISRCDDKASKIRLIEITTLKVIMLIFFDVPECEMIAQVVGAFGVPLALFAASNHNGDMFPSNAVAARGTARWDKRPSDFLSEYLVPKLNTNRMIK